MEKYHKQEVSPVEGENERDETFEADNPQIDSKRTKNNYHIFTVLCIAVLFTKALVSMCLMIISLWFYLK